MIECFLKLVNSVRSVTLKWVWRRSKESVSVMRLYFERFSRLKYVTHTHTTGSNSEWKTVWRNCKVRYSEVNRSLSVYCSAVFYLSRSHSNAYPVSLSIACSMSLIVSLFSKLSGAQTCPNWCIEAKHQGLQNRPHTKKFIQCHPITFYRNFSLRRCACARIYRSSKCCRCHCRCYEGSEISCVFVSEQRKIK